MDKLINSFLVYLKFNKGISASSQKSYLSDLRLFNNFIEDKKINYLKVNKDIISSYLKYLRKKEYADSSISRKISTLKQFFAFLLKKEIIKINPSKHIKYSKKEQKIPVMLSIEEVDKIINIENENTPIHIRNTAIIELLYSCGLRVSELVNLTEQNISYEKNLIKICGKGSKERVVPFGKKALKKLNLYTENARPKFNKQLSSVFFLNKNGNKISRQQIWNIIKKKMYECGINKNISPHTLRHSFATHLLNNGASIHIIQKLLGHELINTTEVYTHLSIDNLQKIHHKFHPRN